MIELENKKDCCGCHACYNICPVNAINMTEDEYGFRYPNIDKKKCINCNKCKEVCPIINKPNNNNVPKAYAAYNKDTMIRTSSSSGGIFTLIANYILENKGVVYGASFDKMFMVNHIKIDNMEGLDKLRTSKYLQSIIGETYRDVKDELNKGKKVLFTGTPCQINGLYAFLGKNYDNLYTQDIICHGVPSSKVWKKYLEYRKEMDKEQPIEINFRDKSNGWNPYKISFVYKDKKYQEENSKDLYMRSFLQNMCLRDSCYDCNFKDENRISDITLGDFWGINNLEPEMNDNKGVSLVIVNSDKGRELFSQIEEKMIFKNVDFRKSISYNYAMNHSVSKNKHRANFFENMDNTRFDTLVNKYYKKPSVITMFLKKIKEIIKKIIRGAK